MMVREKKIFTNYEDFEGEMRGFFIDVPDKLKIGKYEIINCWDNGSQLRVLVVKPNWDWLTLFDLFTRIKGKEVDFEFYYSEE